MRQDGGAEFISASLDVAIPNTGTDRGWLYEPRNFILDLCRGGCSILLHLQMAGRRAM